MINELLKIKESMRTDVLSQDIAFETYISFCTAKILEEKNCPLFPKDGFYDIEGQYVETLPTNLDLKVYPIYTQQRVMSWLRKKNIVIIVRFNKGGFYPRIYIKDNDVWYVEWKQNIAYTYEDAIEFGILYAIKNLI